MKHAFKLLAAAALLSSSLSALAGEFNANCYSNSACAEVAAPFVTDEFVKAYPAKKWALFVHSTVLLVGEQPICMGTAGVVPDYTGQFPAKRYSSIRVFEHKKTSLTPGERVEYESQCVRDAVASMMTDRPENMYAANTLARK